MDTMKCILTRRSVRDYTGEKVTREEMTELLRAAMWAPSGMGKFPWEFVVIDDPELVEKIPSVHFYAKFAPAAGSAVLICANMKLTTTLWYAAQDCSAAAENLMLAAHSMGLGTCWCGVLSETERQEGFKKLVGIEDDDIVPMALVVVGHPASVHEKPDRFDTSRIHYNKW